MLNSVDKRKFVERHLNLENKLFLIAPNGGTGDCCFKAIGQAIEGTEVNHCKIREEVVTFIIKHRWEKLTESIEYTHVQGNVNLQKKWAQDAYTAYQNYMSTSGTLGSPVELNAAGELFHYNFVTIQEYTDEDGNRTYRVENCCPFNDPTVPFHYFLFTGDYENGHWEYLQPLKGCSSTETICDGCYKGQTTVVIDGVDTTVEEWLKINTENTNDAYQLEHTVVRYPADKKHRCPFESEEFQYESDGSITLDGIKFRVRENSRTDLFSVLLSIIFPEVKADDEGVLDRLEHQIIDYRVGNLSLLNYKLITQPHSHGFDLPALKVLGMAFKGNIQDLLSAADIFGFSFQVFIKDQQHVRSCRFVHVDRWGGETDRMLSFFMRNVSPEGSSVQAKWWHLLSSIENDKYSTDKDNNNNPLEGLLEPQGEIWKRRDTAPSGNHTGTESEGEEETQQTFQVMTMSQRVPPDAEELKTSRTASWVQQSLSKEKNEIGRQNANDVQDVLSSKKSGSRSRDSHGSKKSYKNNLELMEPESQTETENEEANETKIQKKGSAEPKFNTVVEIYDNVTNKKKQYRFKGYKTKDQVIEMLTRRGFISGLEQTCPSASTNTVEDKNENIDNAPAVVVPQVQAQAPPIPFVTKDDQITNEVIENTVIKSNSNLSENSASAPLLSKSSRQSSTETSHVASKTTTNVKSETETSDSKSRNVDVESQEESDVNADGDPETEIQPPGEKISNPQVVSVGERDSQFLKYHQRASPFAKNEASSDNNAAPKKNGWFKEILSWLLGKLFSPCKKAKVANVD